MGSDASDINNDGRIDLFVADMSSTSHYRAKVTMGDMTSDAWFLDHSDPKQYMRNMMFVNSGVNRFLETAFYSGIESTDWTWSVKFADLDADGLADLFVTNGMSRDFQNTDLKQQSIDFQKDGKINAPHEFWEQQSVLAERNRVYRNAGDLKFVDETDSWGLGHNGVSLGAAFGDLDGDGDFDVVVNNFAEAPKLYRNDVATDANQLTIQLVGRASNRMGLGAELRLYCGNEVYLRQANFSRGFMSSDEPIVHFGLGENKHADKLEISWPSGAVQVLQNLTAGCKYVVEESTTNEPSMASDSEVAIQSPLFVASDACENVVHNENSFDDFALQPLLPNRLSQLGPDMTAADVNDDGVEELFVGGGVGFAGQLFQLSDGKFKRKRIDAFELDAKCEDLGSTFFDVDGDQDLDLYVVSGGIEHEAKSKWFQDRIYVNDGDGNFDRAQNALPDLRFSGSCAMPADFDRDGDMDLFVGGRVVPGQYPVAASSYLLRNESSEETIRFVDTTDENAASLKNSGLVTGGVWSDVNNDDWPDLVITYEWGPIKLLLNNNGVLEDMTEQFGLSKLTGWWNDIVGLDFDNDGDQDFIVTNFGTNTKYHASAKHPSLLFYNEFDASGKYQIVEAKTSKDGRLLPVRGRSCSSHAVPMLASKFPTYHEFALAELEDIYTPDCLGESLRLEASELRTGILVNNSDTFEFKALPMLAQISPGYQIAVLDANRDQNLDVFICQNFYGPQRETGRMSGGLGLLMLGDGKGNFKQVWPHESGISIPGDATAVEVMDLNGDGVSDLVVATNGGKAHSYYGQ